VGWAFGLADEVVDVHVDVPIPSDMLDADDAIPILVGCIHRKARVLVPVSVHVAFHVCVEGRRAASIGRSDGHR
jgi:hypothetical protein